MAGYLITSLLSLITNLLPSITASAQAPSSSSSNSNNSERGRARVAEEDLERLMRILEQIKHTLYDAHEREIRDHSVKYWLKELKKVSYDAEDVLSEYQYEVTRVQLEARKASAASGSHKREKMEYIVPILDGMVDQFNKIRSQFYEIAKDGDALQLTESDGVRRQNNKILRLPTSHIVDEASVFGRDAEKKEVIDFLLCEKEKPFSVISIIGKGGLGKTTIAQLVYKDERVTRYFDLNGWVGDTEEFDVRILIKRTIESFSNTNCGLSELSQLQEKLAKTVKGKTILLVLDDVWNENHNLWKLFRVPFKVARVVRILVTTRNKKVAKVMQTTTFFNPSKLSEYSCWHLFQHYAFSGTSYTMPIHLVDMGREITRKCGGLPLAVKSIASLLRHETDEEFWREILENGLWEIKESKEDIFPALQISYAHLPAHLKLCFLFCSMYPKDYLLEKMHLIALWISHGYIPAKDIRRSREIGVKYYEELKDRLLLDDFSYGSSQYCKLRHITHDLARLNSENEHYSILFRKKRTIYL
ncbi:putative disease resistance RPP13-like protein 1 [Carex rostrata]